MRERWDWEVLAGKGWVKAGVRSEAARGMGPRTPHPSHIQRPNLKLRNHSIHLTHISSPSLQVAQQHRAYAMGRQVPPPAVVKK